MSYYSGSTKYGYSMLDNLIKDKFYDKTIETTVKKLKNGSNIATLILTNICIILFSIF